MIDYSTKWVMRHDSLGNEIFEIKGSSPFIRECTQVENNRLNYTFHVKFGMGFQVPREGFYLIKDVHFQDKFDHKGKEQAANVFYKKDLAGKFIDIGMAIRLQPLFNKVSKSPDKQKYSFNKESLVDKIIQVESVDLVWDSSEKNYQTYRAIWKVTDIQTSKTIVSNVTHDAVYNNIYEDEFFDLDGIDLDEIDLDRIDLDDTDINDIDEDDFLSDYEE